MPTHADGLYGASSGSNAGVKPGTRRDVFGKTANCVSLSLRPLTSNASTTIDALLCAPTHEPPSGRSSAVNTPSPSCTACTTTWPAGHAAVGSAESHDASVHRTHSTACATTTSKYTSVRHRTTPSVSTYRSDSEPSHAVRCAPTGVFCHTTAERRSVSVHAAFHPPR